MMSNIYSYTNSYVPFSKECVVNDSPSVPTRIYERCLMDKQRLSDSPYSVLEQFSRPIIMRCTKGRPSVPNDPNVYDTDEAPIYGDEETYLYVYGRRPTVALELRDQERAWRYADPRNLRKLINLLRAENINSVVDAKLTYKRPYIHAAAGPRYMVQLYFGGIQAPEHWRLRNLLGGGNFELSTIFTNALHNSSVTPYTQWYIANRASIHGEFELLSPIHAHRRKVHDRYMTGTCYYKDVRFVNDEGLVIREGEAQSYTQMLIGHYERVIASAANGAVADVLRAGLHKVRVQHGANCEWREFKERALYPAFLTGSAHTPYCQLTTAFIEAVRALPGRSTTYNTTHEGLTRAVAELCRLHSEMRKEAKQFWHRDIRTKHLSDEQKRLKERRLLLHTNALRWGFIDIEVSYVPHCRNEDLIEINVIAVALCDHGHTVPSEAVVFMLIAQERRDGGIKEAEAQSLRTDKVVKMALAGLHFPNLNSNFHIRYFLKEQELLSSFIDYVRDARLHALGYFNGHKFDLPFIVARLTYLNMTDYVTKARKSQANDERTRTMAISLTHRRDVGTIRYRRKMPKKNHRAYGVEIYAQSIEQLREESRAFVTDEYNDVENTGGGGGDDDDSEMENNTEFIPIPSVQASSAAEEAGISTLHKTSSKISAMMVPARQIMAISMNNIALLDVMLEVGDRNRGCKLDVASKTWLNVEKMHDERVSYENLTKTWRFGNLEGLEAIAAYCARDTILALMLAKHKKISPFYMGDSALSFMNFRELFLAEMVKSTIATQCGYGYWQNVSMPDTTLIRDERPLWVPGYNFVAEHDFDKLSPLAGRTVQNSGFYNIPMITVDFAAQYPSIQRAHNICSSSWITAEQARHLPDNSHKSKVIYNVRPIVRHACAKYGVDCHGGLEKRGDPRRCKYEEYFERVETTIRYTRSEFFRGLVPQSLEDLAVLRKEYKRLMVAATKNTDRELYNALQLAVKCRMNAAYGVTLRLTPLVGSTVTQYGREQTERIAEKGRAEAMMVANGDTDSVMVLDKSVCKGADSAGRLSRMSRNLCNGEPRAPIATIIRKMMEKYESFCSEANATLHPPPCSIELEKVFIFQRMDEKKCYLGEKILPGSLALTGHRAGMTGMKGDRTEVKAAAQFIPGKMAGNMDMDGLVLYARHLYDAVSVRLRAHEIAQTTVNDLCDIIDLEIEDFVRDDVAPNDSDDKTLYVPPWRKSTEIVVVRSAAATSRQARHDLAMFDVNKRQEAIETAHCNGDILPFEWMTSTEKVGDVANPVTVATKAAIRQCKRNGVDKHTAQLFVNMARKHEVQASAPLLKSLEVLLRAPERTEWREHREAIEEQEMGTKAWERERKRRREKDVRDVTRQNKVTKLSITKMPDQLVAPHSDRVELTERERAELYSVIKYIWHRDATIQNERKGKFTDLILEKPLPLTNEESSRLRMFIAKFQPAGLHAPLWWYDEAYCETRLESLANWHSLPHPKSACDLWGMYVRSGMARRFLHVKGGLIAAVKASDERIEGALLFDCDDCSWDRDTNVHQLATQDEEQPAIFTLDMSERYARQTRTTPFIVTSIDGTRRYLTNKDSYCPNRPNRFSFAVHLAQLLNMSRATAIDVGGMNTLISFRPLVGTRNVCVRSRCSAFELTDVCILRDDKRSSTHWFWDDEAVYVRRTRLDSILTRLRMWATKERLKTVEVRFDSEVMSVQCAIDAKKYSVPCSTVPDRVPVLETPTPLAAISSKLLLSSDETRKRSAQASVSQRGKRSRRPQSTDVKPSKQTTLIAFLTPMPSQSSDKS